MSVEELENVQNNLVGSLENVQNNLVQSLHNVENKLESLLSPKPSVNGSPGSVRIYEKFTLSDPNNPYITGEEFASFINSWAVESFLEPGYLTDFQVYWSGKYAFCVRRLPTQQAVTSYLESGKDTSPVELYGLLNMYNVVGLESSLYFNNQEDLDDYKNKAMQIYADNQPDPPFGPLSYYDIGAPNSYAESLGITIAPVTEMVLGDGYGFSLPF